jgi:outer membrane immunogenic protein
MISKRGCKQLLSGTIAAGLAGGVAALSLTAANAQNAEGAYQVRVGAFMDLGGTRLSNTNTLDDGGSTDTGKFGAGMTGGLEMLRAGKWTLGVEGDLGISGGGGQTLNGVRFGTDYFSSLRGRAGFYIHPDWVLYGTGGIAFRGVTVDAGPSFGTKVQKTLSGGVFGAGTEWHYGGTILFAEYLHTSLGGADFATNGTSYHVSGHNNTVRLGVKFKLGYDGYYDYVRDELRK